ncbi:acylphosphatase [Candidatus Parcubacteria bacterium]|nr:acylphosphatase [Candidatus Parcubacteria bacterium]
MERMEAVVQGRVQMVLFRDFAQRKAKGLGLVGEVANEPDGTVRVIAEGPRGALDMYVQELKKGPLLARVDDVAVAFSPKTGEYASFEINYD